MDTTSHAPRKQPLTAAAQPQPPPPLPTRLLRSRSGAPTAMSVPVQPLTSPSSSQRFSLRSNSTTRSRSTSTKGPHQENLNSISLSSSMYGESNGLRSSNGATTRRARTAPPSPSAWTRSPGRLPAYPLKTDPLSSSLVSVKSEGDSGGGGGGGSRGGSISKVLKYFRQKKVSPLKEEELHKLRIFHTRLLQWRFANARAESTMLALKMAAEERLFKACIMISKLRQTVAEKRVEMQKLTETIKLHGIIMPQICLLQDWAKLETKYNEGLNRLIRKLSAFSATVPLLHGAKADLGSVNEALLLASEVMDNLKVTCIRFSDQAKTMHHLLIEASEILAQEWECLETLDNVLPDVLTLMERERILRVQLIQSAEEAMRAVAQAQHQAQPHGRDNNSFEFRDEQLKIQYESFNFIVLS